MKKKGISLFLILLSLSTMACQFSFGVPWDVGAPDVEISPDDVAAAATRAAEVAATAASVADQAGQIAATAVAGDTLPDVSGAAGAVTALERKLTSISPDANGNFTITITDADMAEYLALQGGAFENDDARIENVQVNFTPQNVVITGNVTKPVSLPLTAELRPVAADGRLYFQVINASAGVLPVPESMLSVLEAGVNVGLGQAMSYLPAEMTLLDVALGSGSMTALGQVK